MSNRSSVSALVKVIDDWAWALDQGNEVCVIFDVRKAFDRVPHLTLLHQLQELALDPYLLRWLSRYLSNRTQYVAVEGESSSTLPVLSGVPQGSVLGPLLFVAYINDVTTTISPESEINLFADDIALYRTIKSSDDYDVLQGDINSIASFMSRKHLQFNADKCQFCLLYTSPSPRDATLSRMPSSA